MDSRTLNLKGSILGVSFDVVVEAPSENALKVTGEAWGMPVSIIAAHDNEADEIVATGTLLGNEFTINGTVAELVR